MIAVIDYGMGNIHSIKKALEACGAKTSVTNKPADIAKCSKLVLPGVGGFGQAMAELRKRKLIEPLKKEVAAGKPFLGICLGMQILFDSSLEAPGVKGLGIIKGKVVKFRPRPDLLVPQMGWNQLKIRSRGCRLLKNVPSGSYVYFCHSYYAPADRKFTAASCCYGVELAAVVQQGNVFGTQFHPEKSQAIGMRMLKNFIRL